MSFSESKNIRNSSNALQQIIRIIQKSKNRVCSEWSQVKPFKNSDQPHMNFIFVDGQMDEIELHWHSAKLFSYVSIQVMTLRCPLACRLSNIYQNNIKHSSNWFLLIIQVLDVLFWSQRLMQIQQWMHLLPVSIIQFQLCCSFILKRLQCSVSCFLYKAYDFVTSSL